MYRLGFEYDRFFPQKPEHSEPIPEKPLSPAAFLKLSLRRRMEQMNAVLDDKSRVIKSAEMAKAEVEKPRK